MNKNKKNYYMWIVYALMLVLTVMSASAVTQDDLLNGLVRYYDGSYSSTTAIDVHGTFNGTASNSRVFGTPVQIGNGFDFSNGNDYISLGNIGDLDTISFWSKFSVPIGDGETKPTETILGQSGNDLYRIFLGTAFASPTGTNIIYIADAVSEAWYWDAQDFSATSVNNRFEANTPYHFVFYWNSSDSYVYASVNDEVVRAKKRSTPNRPTYSALEYGRANTLYASELSDELIIYNRMLNTSEISTLYDIQKDGLESGSYDFSGAFVSNFSVSGFDSWSDDALSSINVSVDGTVYSNASGNSVVTDVLSNSTVLHDVVISSPGYFSLTYNDYNVSTGSLSAYLNQSEIRFDAYEFLSEDEITSFNVTINDTTKNESESWGLSAGEYNATFSSSDYLNETISFNVSALDNLTLSFYNITGSILNIDVVDAWSNSTINNFSGWLYTSEFDNNETFNTTTGSVMKNIKRNVNYTVFVESEDYAITDDNYQYVVANSSETNISFSLYQTNSLDINFKEDDTKDLIDQLVTLELISEDNSYNFNTTNGTIRIEFVVPSSYTFRYRSEGYDEGFYRVIVSDRSYNDLDLYMINSTASSPVTLTVIDESASPVEGYVVKSLKYDQETNSYIIQEVKETDFLGEAIFNVRKNEEYYRFIIENDGVMLRMTNPSYITADSLTIQVITTDLIAGQYFDVLGVTSLINYNNVTGNFRAEYNDESNIGSLYCLRVKKLSRTTELIGEECSTSPSAVLLFNQPFEENSIYEAELYLTVDGEERSLGLLVEDWTVSFDAGDMGLIIQILLTIFFAMTFMYNPSMGAIMTPMSILLGRIIGLNSLSWTHITPLIIIGLIVVYLMER